MKNLKTFEECCRYLGISEELPKCQIDERQIQASYKIKVCMKAWNKYDKFEVSGNVYFGQKVVGYSPHFYYKIKEGKLFPSGASFYGSLDGLVFAYATFTGAFTYALLGIQLCFSTSERAVEFSEIFIDIFRELV